MRERDFGIFSQKGFERLSGFKIDFDNETDDQFDKAILPN